MNVLASRLTDLVRVALRLRPNGPRQWWKLSAVALPGVVVASLLLTSGPGDRAPQVNLSLGRIWLASARVDQATLLDGTSLLVESRVGLPRTDDGLDEVVTAGANADALLGGGKVSAVDGATDIASPPKKVLAGATDTHLYASDTDLFVVGFGGNGHPASLAVARPGLAGAEAHFAIPQSIVAATLDNGGRLWMLARDGTLYWTDGTALHHRSQSSRPSNLLGTSGNTAVLAQDDTDKPTATLLDATTGESASHACLKTATNDPSLRDPTLQIGAAPAGRVYTTSSRDGTLLVTNLAKGTCSVVHIAPEGDRLGPPLSAEDRVFVPNYSTGATIIVNPDTGTHLAATLFQRPLPRTFQLLTKDDIVYYNNPFGTQAGVIKPDGTVDSVAKYDPADPTRGIAAPRLATPTLTTPTPPKANAPSIPRPPTTLPVPAKLPQGRPVTAPTAPPGTLAGAAPDTAPTTTPSPRSPSELLPSTTTLPQTIRPATETPSLPTTLPAPQVSAPEEQTPTQQRSGGPGGATQPQGGPAGGGGGPGASGTTLPGNFAAQGHLEIVTNSLDPATITLAYNEPLKGSGGQAPYQWRESGLPNGLTIDADTGQITGTPAANDVAGTDPIQIILTDSQGTVVQTTIPLVLKPAPLALPISPAHLPVAEGPEGSASAGADYEARFGTEGGTAPYTWTVTGLPQGFSADGDTISGNALASSRSATILVKVTDSSTPARTGEAEYTFAVNHAPVAPDVPTVATPLGKAVAVNFVPPASDPDGDALTVTSISHYSQFQPPRKKGESKAPPEEDCGSTTINNTTATFTPATNFSGPCTFQYTVSDGALSAVGNATVDVTDHAPVVDPENLLVDSQHMATENNEFSDTYQITDGTLGPGDTALATSPDHNPLSVSDADVEPADAGTVTIDPAQDSVTFFPAPGFVGNAVVDYTVTDGADSAPGTITVPLTDTAPVAQPMTAFYAAQGLTVIDVTNPPPDPNTGAPGTPASDPDGDPIVIGGLSGLTPSSSTVSIAIDPDGHAIDVTGTALAACGVGQVEAFNYTVSDGPPGSSLGETSEPATITLEPDC